MVFEYIVGGIACTFLLYKSMVIIRPTHRGLVERLGKYYRFLEPGVSMRIPFVDSVVRVNITEQMVDAKQQQVITLDNLNAGVDAQIYFKVKHDETNVKNSQYNVNDYELQIVQLARTTLRDIIGKMPFKDVNNKRNILNDKLASELKRETSSWGIEVVRTELQEIEPPDDVQETMNKVLKAENEKIASTDFATAREIEADGIKRASIKEAEGFARSVTLKAEAEANALKLVSESAEKYFKGRAERQRQLQVVENSLRNGTKYVLSTNSSLLNVLPLGDEPSSSLSGDVVVDTLLGSKKIKKFKDDEE